MTNLLEKNKAPDFTLPNQDEANVCLSEFKGKYVVLYFYPKDNTPGCTIEALDFTRFKKDFEKLNCVVIGISKDDCSSHKKFVGDKNLKITLLSDSDTKVQQKYGVWRMKKFMGREFMGTVRSTFLIDTKGTIVKHWD